MTFRVINRDNPNERSGPDQRLVPDDLADVRASLKGDPEAYRRLVERYQDHVARIMWRFSRNPAIHEELIQDVFVEAYLSLSGFRAKAPFEHWLARIATRVGYHYWKNRTRRKQPVELSVRQWDRLCGPIDQEILAKDAAELLHCLMAQLPPRDRLVLSLRYLDGFDVSETSKRTGWSNTMVKVQTLRARKKLKKLFDESQGQSR